MSIVVASNSNFAYSASNGTTISVSLASGITSGDGLVMIVGMKPSSANLGAVETPSGFSTVAVLTGAGGYGSTLGADTGNTHLYGFFKTADGSESSPVTVTVSTNSVAWAATARLTKTLSNWSTGGATGSKTTGTSLVSITFGADPGIASNDVIVIAFNIATDVQTPAQFEGESLAATGATFSALTEIGEPDSSLGLDIGGVICRTVASGTGSTAPVFTARASGTVTNVRGPGIIMRLRETNTPPATPTVLPAVMMHEPYVGRGFAL